jgi:hypothetical protein
LFEIKAPGSVQSYRETDAPMRDAIRKVRALRDP